DVIDQHGLHLCHRAVVVAFEQQASAKAQVEQEYGRLRDPEGGSWTGGGCGGAAGWTDMAL
ncbi:hypothetical protein, partial [Pseudofulvimonas gallinarii]|uniref:hypothetical protein n=1 Tax=Pseudofulvimonas gallinarii TaxID=634155 RepID=UPI0035EE639D